MMKKLYLVSWITLMLFGPVSSALASPADRDRDGLPDRWERKHHLSTHKANANSDHDRDRVDNRNEYRERTNPVKRDSDADSRPDGREDADRDGLTNAAEDASGNDPRNPDSDHDTVPDGDEHAGEVASFSGGVLTIRLATGGTLTATVSEDTDIGCGLRAEAERLQMAKLQALIANAEGDEGEYDDSGDDMDQSDPEYLDDLYDFEDFCSPDQLARGTGIREAMLDPSTSSNEFYEVELVRAR